MALVRFYVDVPLTVTAEALIPEAGSARWYLMASNTPNSILSEGYKRYSFDVDLPIPGAINLGSVPARLSEESLEATW